MTLTETNKLAKHICRLLKVQDITIPIGRTPKGNLGLSFNANNDGFEIMLDSIPLSTKSVLDDENNIELKRMLEKYLFDQEQTVIFKTQPTPSTVIPTTPVSQEKKKGGRPKGSKNKNGNLTTEKAG